MNNKIYECKTGKYIILNKEPSVNGRTMVKIRFLESGNEYVVRKDNALIGNVREPSMKRGRIPAEVDYNRIYNTNYGPVRIVREMQNVNDVSSDQRYVEIEFINSGYRKIIKYHCLRHSKDFVNIRDDSVYNEKHEIGTDKLYDSNKSGKFRIIRKTGDFRGSDPMVEIRFEKTGFTTIIPLCKALYGCVKDPYYPIIDGVGFFGECNNTNYNKKEYNIWRKMISRCYSESDSAYTYYGAVGVSVDPDWFNFSTFSENIKHVDGYQLMMEDPCNYSLDKDLKQLHLPKDQRIYSKDTCTFITNSDNSKIARYEENKMPYEILMMSDLNVSKSLKTMVTVVDK